MSTLLVLDAATDFYHGMQICISKKEGKDQESIQSSTTPGEFIVDPICILCISVCLYMLFYVQSIQIKYV